MGSVSDFIVNIIFKGKDQTSVPAASAASGMDKLARAAKFAAGAFAAIKSAQVAVEFLELGASVETAEARLIAFAGSTEQATAYLEAMDRASYGTIDRLTAMSYASRLVQMGIATTTDEMEKQVAMAIRLGDQTMTVEQRMDTWTMMMANQSKLRLDTFGISSGQVTARMKELEAQGLSTEEAFKQATFEIGSVALAKLGDTSGSTAVQIQKVKKEITDLKLAAASAFSEIVGGTGIIGDLADRLAGLPTTLQQINILWRAFYAAVKPVWDIIVTVGKAINWLVLQMNPLYQIQKLLQRDAEHLGQTLELLGIKIRPLNQGIVDAAVNNDAFRASMEKSLGVTQEQTAKVDALSNSLSRVPKKVSVLIQIQEAMGRGIAKLTGRQSGGLASGMTLVGERGPELVQLPIGSNVYNHSQSHAITNNYNMTVNTQADAPSVRQDFAMMRALYA